MPYARVHESSLDFMDARSPREHDRCEEFPLYRHPALRPLSREHHGALVLARLARWACAGQRGSVSDVRVRVLHEWSTLLAPHFAAEERWLAPHAGELSASLLAQHRAIGVHVAELSATEDAAHLASFGVALDEHVRWEEHVLFPALEASLDAETLARIGELLDGDGRGAACALP